MQIKPLPGIVQLAIDEIKSKVLDTSSYQSAVEFAEIIAVGTGFNMENFKVGDKVFVKSWGIDIVSHNDKRYYFVNVQNQSILAVVK